MNRTAALLLYSFLLSTPLSAATPNMAFMSKTRADENCVPGPRTDTFLTTDSTAWLYAFVQSAAAGDVLRVEWVRPDGVTQLTSTHQPLSSSGDWCFSSGINIANNAAAQYPGQWTVRGYWNGASFFTVNFTLSTPGGSGGGGSGAGSTLSKLLTVEAKSNIFAAGRSSAFSGNLPPGVRFAPGPDKVLTISSASGVIGCDSSSGRNGADGGQLCGGSTNINSYRGIAGIIHDNRTNFLVGVFLDDSEPADPAPARLNVTDTYREDIFFPQLRQVFFIGDGMTGEGSGYTQRFYAPANATRLYLGIADAGYFQGNPGYYDDNAGSFNITIQMTNTVESGSAGGGGGGGGTSGTNLISNGGFEAPGGSGGYISLGKDATTIANWVVSFGSVDYIVGYYPCSEGKSCVDLGGMGAGGIAQTIDTVAAQQYTLTFDMAANIAGSPTVKRLQVTAGGQTSPVFTFDATGRSESNMGWSQRSWTFTASSSRTTLDFRNLEDTAWGPMIDNVRVVAGSGGGGGGTSGCTYTAVPTSAQFSSNAGNGSFALNTTSGCSWSASPSATWIQITGAQSGTGSATITYSVGPNTGSSSRTATITAGTATHTVTQAGATAACTVSLNPTTASVASASTSGTIAVTASSSGCSWTASSTATWLSIDSGTSGTGNGTIRYSVSANIGAFSRSGDIRVLNATFTLTQSGAGGGGGGTMGTNLIRNPGAEEGTSASCRTDNIPNWTTSGRLQVCRYGIDDFPPASAPGPPDRGTYLFAGSSGDGLSTASQIIDVSSMSSQIDSGAKYNLSAWLGGWEYQDDNAQLTVTFRSSSGASLGTAKVGPVMASDRASATGLWQRSTTGTVPERTRSIEVLLEITRASGAYNDGYADNLFLSIESTGGGSCSYALRPTSAEIGASGGAGAIDVSTGSGCSWQATSNSAWLTIDSGASGTGNGTIRYSAAANTSTTSRSAQIRVSSATFTLTQAGATGGGGTTGTNLIRNPGAEEGTSTSCRTDNIPNWTTSGRLQVCRYGVDDFPPASAPGPTDRGTYLFAGSSGDGLSTATQTIDVTSLAAQIDSGARYNLSAWLGGWDTQDDNAKLTVTFFSSSGASLGKATVGPVLATHRASVTGLWQRSTTGTVPERTRRIEVLLEITRTSGAYNDGYADNLFLSIESGGGGGGGGGSCSYTLNPTSANVAADGGAGVIEVNTASTCNWQAVSDASWLTITRGSSGTGTGEVRYSASANSSSSSRSATITVGGTARFRVTQAGTGGGGGGSTCSVALIPTSFTAPAAATDGSFRVVAAASCSWRAESPASWVSISSGSTGTGDGTVKFSVSEHTGGTNRTSTITVNGTPFNITQVAPGNPMISEGAVVNAASQMPAIVPGGAIAQGAIFMVQGKDLGPAAAAEADGTPLSQTLGGVSIQVKQGSRTLDAWPVYVSSTVIRAVMPSDTPTGEVNVVITYDGKESPPMPARVVVTNFGALGQQWRPAGPAMLQNSPDDPNSWNSITAPARRGQTVTLHGTGLGPITTADNEAPQPQDLPYPVEIMVGGKVVTQTTYVGRLPGSPGRDIITFTIPEDAPEHCFVPVQVKSGDGFYSNMVTIAVSESGACSVGTNPLGQIQQKGKKTGAVALVRIDAVAALDPAQPPTEAKLDLAGATFQESLSGSEEAFNPFAALPPKGTCFAFGGAVDTSSATETSSSSAAKELDAGPTLTVSGDKGAYELQHSNQEEQTGPYFAHIGGTMPTEGGPSLPMFLEGGNYTISGPGGKDVGSFRKTVSFRPPVTWTNRTDIMEVDRAAGVTFTWTPGDPNTQAVMIAGFVSNQQTKASGGFVCNAAADAGTFTVPPSALANVPPGPPDTKDVIPMLIFGTIPRGELPSFTAAGIDYGYVLGLFLNSRTVPFK